MATKGIQYKLSQAGAEAVNNAFAKIDKSLASMAKQALATVTSIYALKKAYDATIGAAIKEEETFRKLQTAVEKTGKSWSESKGDLDKLFASLQATTQYGDTESAEVLTTLIQLTSDYDKSVRALPVALDLAATGLFDNASAARYVAMALEGNVEILGRYIPELKAENNEIIRNGTAAEKSAEFMRIFNEKFAGTAQKNLESTAGRFKQLTNYLGDIGESIGIIALPAINNFLKGIIDLIKPNQDLIDIEQRTIENSEKMRAEFDSLTQSLLILGEKENLSNEELKLKNKIIQDLQKLYPNYFGNLEKEANNFETLKGAISRAREQLELYINQTIQNAIIQKYTDKIAQLTTKIIENKAAITELEIANEKLRRTTCLNEYEQKANAITLKNNKSFIEYLGDEIKRLSNELESTKEKTELAKKEIEKYTNAIAPSVTATRRLSEETKEAADNIKEIISPEGIEYDEYFGLDPDQIAAILDEIVDIGEEHADLFSRAWFESNREIVKTFQTLGSQLTSTMSSFSALQSALAQNRIREYQDEADAKIKAIQESSKEEVIKEFEIAQVKDDLRRKEQAEMKKLKPLQVAMATANTALAITQAWADPTITSVLAKVAMTAMIAASGAAQIATIQAQKYASGGIVQGTGTRDTVPAMLTPGEVILNKAQQENLARQLGNTLIINVYGNFTDVDRLAAEIAERSNLGFNRIMVKN